MTKKADLSTAKKNKIQILLWWAIGVGTFLRLYRLGNPPLWIDEALFAGWAKSTPHQEFITVFLAKLLPGDELFLRLPVALAGSLTIFFFYRMTGEGWKSFFGAAFIAVFPIFVFWSRVARPYAFAGLFLVLGWRWWIFYIPAILTTPISLIGLNLWKLKEGKYRIYYAALLLLAVGIYIIRPDVAKTGDFIDPAFLFAQKRFWYLPMLTGLLYACSMISDKYFQSPGSKSGFPGIPRIAGFVVLVFLTAISLGIPNKMYGPPEWYAQYCWFTNWKDPIVHVDCATNVPVAQYYSGGNIMGIRDTDQKTIDAEIEKRGCIVAGLDYYALTDVAHLSIEPLVQRFGDELAQGGVAYVKICKQDKGYSFHLISVSKGEASK